MSIEKVRKYLAKFEKDKDILEMDESTATVELAAQAIGIIPARIAKSMAMKGNGDYILLVTAGDARIDNRKFRDEFDLKATMLSFEETAKATGHAVGGVCPFALPNGIKVALDKSLKRFESVYPACGSSNSAVKMSIPELEQTIPNNIWVDVCKDWDENLS